MDSQKRNHCIVAKLGKVEKVLKNLETKPSLNDYSTTIRRGRYVLRSAMKDLAKEKGHKVNWNLVVQVFQLLIKVYDTIQVQI